MMGDRSFGRGPVQECHILSLRDRRHPSGRQARGQVQLGTADRHRIPTSRTAWPATAAYRLRAISRLQTIRRPKPSLVPPRQRRHFPPPPHRLQDTGAPCPNGSIAPAAWLPARRSHPQSRTTPNRHGANPPARPQRQAFRAPSVRPQPAFAQAVRPGAALRRCVRPGCSSLIYTGNQSDFRDTASLPGRSATRPWRFVALLKVLLRNVKPPSGGHLCASPKWLSFGPPRPRLVHPPKDCGRPTA
jgi:hypothetical protein